MSFAALTGLWLGLIAIPIGILYILKIKRHRRTVPYLELWAKLVADKQFTSLFQRFQKLLSLLLQLLIALCIVFAFASLTLSDSYLEEESVVLVVDTSASTNGLASLEGDETRMEAAIEALRGMIEGRPAEDEFAIIAAGAQPEVLQAFTRSTLRLREAVDRLRSTNSVGDLAGAVQLARDLAQDKEHPRIAIVGDAASGVVAKLMAEDPALQWMRIGESVPNVSIRRFQVRRNFALDTDYLLLVMANESEEPAAVEVEISFAGRLRKVLPVEFAAGEEKSETIQLPIQADGFAMARIVHPAPAAGEGSGGTAEGVAPEPGRDGLRLDDVAFAAVPDSRSYKVLLVTRNDAEREPFEYALGSLGKLVDAEAAVAAYSAAWGTEQLPADAVAKFDLVLFVNWAPEQLPATGRYLCINALPGGLPATVRGREKSPKIRDFVEDHPINRFLQAKAITPIEALPVDLTGGETFLATNGGPVGVVFREESRRTVYLGLDIVSDLFFLQVSFPIIVRNVLGWMHEEETALLEPTYRPGEVISPRFAVAGDSVKVAWKPALAPAKPESTTAADEFSTADAVIRDGRFHFGDTDEPGRYWFQNGGEEYRTAVNLFAPTESDLLMPEADTAKSELGLSRAGFLFGRDLWPILLLVAAGAWLLEWALYHRRFTE